MEKQTLKDFYGKIIGYIETDSRGKQTLKNFGGRILGYYDPQYDHTTDFYGTIVGRGNILTTLLRND